VFRLFVLINFLTLSIFACQGEYTLCIKKVKDSKAIRNSSIYIPVKNYKLLVYSKHRPHEKILKHDSFLSLYLVEDKKRFAYPFDIKIHSQTSSAMINTKISKSGTIIKNQIGLNSLAKYSKKLLIPSILTDSCGNLEGIVTPKGIIQKEYLARFISSANVDYADIGVRVKNDNAYVIVTATNAFLSANTLKKNDCILKFDKTKINSASVFMRRVLFSKIGSEHTLKIKRHNKIINLKVRSYKRYGGGNFSDTFLEQNGIYFDKTLHVIRFSKHAKKHGLMIGDKLIQVNEIKVKTQTEVRKYIENFKEFSSLLFFRKGFEFFVNLK